MQRYDLFDGAVSVVNTTDLSEKTELALKLGSDWFHRRIGKGRYEEAALPNMPGRPEKPVLLPPGKMPKRNLNNEKGRQATFTRLHISS